MEVNYQIVIDLACNMMMIAFPIALIFMIVQKVCGIFISFVFGKEVTF